MFSIPKFETWFSQSPEGKAFVGRMLQHQDEERAKLRDEVNAAQKQYDREFAAASKATDAALAKRQAAEKALAAAYQEWATANAHRSALSHRMNTLRARALRKMQDELPDERIVEFERAVRAEHAEMQRGTYDFVDGMQWSHSLDKFVPCRVTNSDAYGRRILALTNLLGRVEELYLSDDVESDIEALWDSLPEFREVWDDPKLAAALKAAKAEQPSRGA